MKSPLESDELGLGKFHDLSLSFLLRKTCLLHGSALSELNERMYVVTLGEQRKLSTCELPPQKARKPRDESLGDSPCPDRDPTLSRTVPSPARAYPGPGPDWGASR